MANVTVTISSWTDPVSNVPAMLISATGGAAAVTIQSWQGSITKGGNVQLYARKVVNNKAAQYQTVGWDGVNEIINQNGWSIGPKDDIWPMPTGGLGTPSFVTGNGVQWSILPQTGGVGGAMPLSTNLGVTPISIPTPGSGQVTLSNVVLDGLGGSGNIILTIDVEDGSGD